MNKAQTEMGKPEMESAGASQPTSLGPVADRRREMTYGPSALTWIGATALMGILYFVGIGAGYVAFVGAIEEFRLRYFLAGIFVLALLFRAYALVRYRVLPTQMAAGMYGLLAVIGVVQGLWFKPIADAGGLDVYLATIGETVIASGILAATGEALGILWIAGTTGRAIWRVGVAFGICVFTIGLGVIMGWSTTAEMRLLFQSQTGDSTIYNYLALGDSIALLGLFMMGLFSRPTVRLGLLGIAGAGLFFAYSRTSFFLFLFCASFVLFVGGKYSTRLGIAAVVAIVLLVVIAVAGESDILQPTIERMTVLLFNREADESYAARKVLLTEGLQYLKESWLIGRFLDEWWREGIGGGYIHNWLSFWQAYGLLPFLASLTLFGSSGLTVWKNLAKPSRFTGTAMAFWTYAILAIVSSRGYAWPFLWFCFGVVSVLTSVEKNRGKPLAIILERLNRSA